MTNKHQHTVCVHAHVCVSVFVCLQSGSIKDALHTLDHAETNNSNIFAMFDNKSYGPEPFDGERALLAAVKARMKDHEQLHG